LSSLLFLFTKSLLASISCFLVGFFIDLDHFFDYWISNKKISTGKEFFDFFYEKKSQKVYVFFHTVELISIIFIIGKIILNDLITYSIILGFTVHLIMDYIGNKPKPPSYFLTYRVYKKFNREIF